MQKCIPFVSKPRMCCSLSISLSACRQNGTIIISIIVLVPDCVNRLFSAGQTDDEFYFYLSAAADLLVTLKVSICTPTATIITSCKAVLVLECIFTNAEKARSIKLSPILSERWTEFTPVEACSPSIIKILISRVMSEPCPSTSERIKCPAESRLILKWSHDHNIPERALVDLFAMFSLPIFNIKNMPRSVYQMKKMARVATPELVCTCLGLSVQK